MHPNTDHDPNLAAQRQRREKFFAAVRARKNELFNPDGSPRIPQFGPPHREAAWMLAALYTGADDDIALANRVISRWHDAPDLGGGPGSRETHGSHFGIFQSNSIIHLYHRFRDKLSPSAEAVMRVHAAHGTHTYFGDGQPDTKYHGANDNMPTMAMFGLVFAGELLGDDRAVRHGLWQLHQLRLLLSRAAWVSEYNSCTYTPITLSGIASLATYARDPEIRALALECEHRLWAEVLLHYHPGTFRQAGPQSRAYEIDDAGHTHGTQFLLWLVFGEKIGRNPMQSHFAPDGVEVLHFAGEHFPSVAGWVELADTDFHVPEQLRSLAAGRQYPARLRGRVEAMASFDVQSTSGRTTTYMEEEFSLGTVSAPFFTGYQTHSLYGTYQLKPLPVTHHDSASFYVKYRVDREVYGVKQPVIGMVHGEKFIGNRGWQRVLQRDNTALLTVTPDPGLAPLTTETLRLDLIFPAHYGKILRNVIGSGPARAGADGESAEVAPVSIEAGEVFIHVFPLLPTNLLRRSALRWRRDNLYEVLELINYEGPAREFSKDELLRALNGFTLTVSAKKNFASLEEFHRRMSAATVTDYLLGEHRFVHWQREDLRFDLVYAPRHGSAQTEAVNGRQEPLPLMESNQLDPLTLPFLSGSVPPAPELFPWGDSLEVCWYPDQPWLIGVRGAGEKPYSRRVEKSRV